MAAGVGAVKPAAHRKWKSVEWKLAFSYTWLLVFFSNMSSLFLSLLKPALMRLRQEDFQELELHSKFVARLSQMSSASVFTSIPKDLALTFGPPPPTLSWVSALRSSPWHS